MLVYHVGVMGAEQGKVHRVRLPLHPHYSAISLVGCVAIIAPQRKPGNKEQQEGEFLAVILARHLSPYSAPHTLLKWCPFHPTKSGNYEFQKPQAFVGRAALFLLHLYGCFIGRTIAAGGADVNHVLFLSQKVNHGERPNA